MKKRGKIWHETEKERLGGWRYKRLETFNLSINIKQK
jgi:hypothetical protein